MTDPFLAAGGSGRFATTRWTVVVQAGRGGEESRAALEALCRAYWHPLYVYARGRGYGRPDAEDRVQGFLVQLLERAAIARADPARGRFRSFLLSAFNHYLADQWDRDRAAKRGGGKVFAMDFASAESWLGQVASPGLTPEQAYERRWALSLLEAVYGRLRERYRGRGRGEVFEVLQVALAGPREAAPYAELAARLGLGPGAVRVAVHRLRREYRELLREAVADLVADPAEVDDELRHLQAVLGRGDSAGNNPAGPP